jgi:glyoxylase-like metal-dependent hydrolase (beta-lactamase superfamily II)
VPAHQLYLVSLGELVYPGQPKGAPERAPIGGYLIRTARGRHILVDTGAPSSLIGAATAAPWAPDAGVAIRPEDDIVVQLSKLGLRPKDIDLLIISHFHFEHCGRHDVFAEANVPAVVQRAHYDHALAHPDRYDRALFTFEGWHYDVVDGDTEIERGLAVIESSGHAIGHQSVYVETASGPILLAIDAIEWPVVAQTREFPAWTEDAKQADASVDKLMQFALDYRTFMIFGHDPGQWNSLTHAPRAFSR